MWEYLIHIFVASIMVALAPINAVYANDLVSDCSTKLTGLNDHTRIIASEISAKLLGNFREVQDLAKKMGVVPSPALKKMNLSDPEFIPTSTPSRKKLSYSREFRSNAMQGRHYRQFQITDFAGSGTGIEANSSIDLFGFVGLV